LCIITALALCCAAAQAGTLYVPSPYSTIQSAINDANDGDIVLVSPGTYQENIDFLGKAVTVQSADPNDPNVVAETIIDGSNPTDPNHGSTVIFKSGEDANSILTGFTITGGTGSWLAISWDLHQIYWNRCGGGAVCYNLSQPTITKNVFSNNFAGEGGAIYVYGNPVDPNNPSNPPVHVKPVITDNIFIDNSAVYYAYPPPPNDYNVVIHGDGGAIVCFQGVDATIRGNLIQNNHAYHYGGGLHLRQWSNGEISYNQIIDNNSAIGAGIHITYTSSPLVSHNIIASNRTTGGGGGGIYVYYNSDPCIEYNFIAGNFSWYSAGIGVYWDSEPAILNNIIVKNQGMGILCNAAGTTIVTGNTIADNNGQFSPGGIRCRVGATPVIERNIIVSNGGYGLDKDPNCYPTVRYNNVWGNTKGNYDPDIGDQTGLNGNISVDPRFTDPDANDYHLACYSPCINAGDPSYTPGPNETDYDGDNRIMSQIIDIGADETGIARNITSSRDYQTIQQAIDDSNNGDVIVVNPGTHTGTGNRDIDFHGKAITLRGIDPNDFAVVAATIIDCNASGRGFRFHTGEDGNSVLAGVTITNGKPIYDGGAIHCNGSSPTIERCIITKNVSKGHGGGIYLGNGSDAIIDRCIITENTFVPEGYGGGIYCYKSNPTITNCIVMNNSAMRAGEHGGGMCFWGDQVVHSDALVANCLVVGNSAPHRGGGLYAYWSSPTFINCTVIGNKALEGGGIGSFRESNPQVINCIVRDNIAPDGNQLALISTLRVWSAFYPTEMTVLFSDIEGGIAQACIDPGCTLNWGNGNIDIEPNFVDPGHWDVNNPGDPNDDFFVSGNYHLPPLSPCVDVGDNNSIPMPSFDIDNEERIFNGTVDMGSDEVVTNVCDLDNDGIVDYFDLEVVANEWLDSGSELQTDFYEDGFIDLADYAKFASQWLWMGMWRY
jgi:hypothetical protein